MRSKGILLWILLLWSLSLGIFCQEEELSSGNEQLSTPGVSSKDVDIETNGTSTVTSPAHQIARFLSSQNVIFGTLVAASLFLQALLLFCMGQPIISRSGTVKLWEGDINGPENSQHILDWYTFTHILHGFLFYAIGGGTVAIFPSLDIGVQAIFILALLLEVSWEVIENSPTVIDRYRQTALANGYTGDSIINSVSDTLAMSVGFWMAYILPPLVVLALAVAEEIILAIVIRDNLLLNVIQLIHPFEFISKWQSGNIPTQHPTIPQHVQ